MICLEWAMMADVTPVTADPMISGTWLIGIIGALSTAAVGIMGKVNVDKARKQRSTIIENQPVGVRLEEQPDPPATKKELLALETRLTTELKKIEEALGKERDIARVANGNLHTRADKSVEVMAEMKGELKQISENVDRLLDLAMKRPAR